MFSGTSHGGASQVIGEVADRGLRWGDGETATF